MSELPDHLLWEYEDALPDDIDGQVYNALFPASRVIGGVRMFPYLTIDGKRYYLARIP